MAEELKYHEQNEGWKHEWLADRHCVCIMRPREFGGGFVTIDFDRRVFSTGYGKPRQGATATEGSVALTVKTRLVIYALSE